MTVRTKFQFLTLFILVSVGTISLYWPPVWWSMLFFGPLILLGVVDIFQKPHSIRRNFPIIGHGRYLLEAVRPEIMQYFVETDTEGRPINRILRSLIYQRAKKANDTTPFGTQMNVYRAGYEWMPHSMYAKSIEGLEADPRIQIGGPSCKQPYSASVLNISAMSFGSLSKNAIMALNWGAKLDNFAHNTGEGGLSPYHLKHGGDIIWQVGTGYFGCRKKDGTFNPETFRENATKQQVKMIEIKISQGAKPGHGGILPAIKNTAEIAAIRHVEPHTTVHSPPAHSAFSSPIEMMNFIQELRELSGGKPVGFKICIGVEKEFEDLCQAMIETGIKPDFITIDGGEGGTGAAPVEFSNSLGMPLRDGLIFANRMLIGYDLKKDIKLLASGKIISGFHIARVLALGADACYSARAMMLALGCIQALQCHNNTCPVGVATQNDSLLKGLVVEEKAKRVANYHHETIYSLREIVAATGLSSPSEISRHHIYKRVGINKVMTYDELFPCVEQGAYLKASDSPE